VFGAISIFLYTSVYTPLKTVTSLSVFVGAFGCNPLLGRVLRREILDEAGTLFLIQFSGNFHFWAIGWFYMKIMKSRVLCLQEEG
jgi:protoheme IX farnesyltransferase